jgi:CheY-like chemotaxis protein
VDSSAKHTILVVEDSDEDFDTLHEGAQQLGLSQRLIRARTGGECIALLSKSDSHSKLRPSLVLLDLNTPGVDGREALASLRDESAPWMFPIVVLTTSADPRDLSYCYARGANALHIKPVRYTEHRDLVVSMLMYWTERVALP